MYVHARVRACGRGAAPSQPLENFPDAPRAARLLTRSSEAVRPICVRRKLRVVELAEFYPMNPGLLGLNMGAGLKIQLR